MNRKKLCVASASQALSLLLASETFDNDDDGEDNLVHLFGLKASKPKVHGFVNDIVHELSEIDFRSHFRLTWSNVEVNIK